MSDEFDVVTVDYGEFNTPVKMTRRAKPLFDIACEEAEVAPVVIQGCFLGDDAASASAGKHDRSGCIDTGSFSINDEEVHRLISAGRNIGAVRWYRPNLPGEWAERQHWFFLGDALMHPGDGLHLHLTGGLGDRSATRSGRTSRGSVWSDDSLYC